jgi:hypothetical protein
VGSDVSGAAGDAVAGDPGRADSNGDGSADTGDAGREADGEGNAGASDTGNSGSDDGHGAEGDAPSLDELKEKAEAYDKLLAERPETPDGYQLKAPEGVELDDQALERFSQFDEAKRARELAHKYGMSEGDFQELFGLHLGAQQRAAEPDMEAERKILGDNWESRVAAASKFVEGLPDDYKPIVAQIAKFGQGVKLIEHLQDSMRQPSLASDASAGESVSDLDQEIDKLQMQKARMHGGMTKEKAALQDRLLELRERRRKLQAS